MTSKDKYESELNCEYLVIGSGAGGAVACKYLSDLGKDVILIEEGDYHEINKFAGSISESFLYAWRNSGITPVLSKTNFAFGEGRCLGGGSYVNGGLIWRTPEIVLSDWCDLFNDKIFSYGNLKKYFENTENILEINKEGNNDFENTESLKIKEIGENKNIKVVKVPKSINSSEKENELTLGAAGLTKNSILEKYIISSKKKGLVILTNCKAEKLIAKKDKIDSVIVKKNGKVKNIIAEKVILACGATQTPILIKKSFGNRYLNSQMSVHLNLRIGVKFNEKIQTKKGIMFTRQLQEYIDDGILIMPTSFNKNNFFSSLVKMHNKDLLNIEKNIDQYGSFIIQLSSLNKVMLNNFFGNTILSYKINNQDIIKLKKYFLIFCESLFDVGADEIFLPLKKNFKINKNTNLIDFLNKYLTQNNIEMVSVHGMSSAKMGVRNSKNTRFDRDGKSFEFKNLYCLDSSVLPSSTIESPQGTIMAIASQIIEKIS